MNSIISLFKSITNLFYLIGIGLYYILTLVSFNLGLDDYHFINKLLTIAPIFLIGFIIKNSPYQYFRLFRYNYICIAIIILGSLLKILHQPFGVEIIASGYLGLFLIYGVYFIEKDNKTLNDFIKILWFSLVLLLKPLQLYHASIYHIQQTIMIELCFLSICILTCLELKKLTKNWLDI